MFCSSCKKIDANFVVVKRHICDAGHIFCKLCDANSSNCIICHEKISNFIRVEINEGIPRIAYTPVDQVINSVTEPESSTLKAVQTVESDDSVAEIINGLNECENCCNKAECERKPTIGCIQVIGHIPDDSSISIELDGEEEREMLKNFCGNAIDTPEILKNASRRSSTSIKSTGTVKKNYSNPVKSSRSLAFGEKNESLIVNNKSSSKELWTETRNSYNSLSSKSPIFSDDEHAGLKNSIPDSVRQLYKNDKSTNESELLESFTSLSASRLEASPPEAKNDSKIPSNAHRAKFTQVYQCDNKYPEQMEPIEYFELESERQTLENVAMSLPRLPITCPCSFCGMITTPSDFFSHITIDHPNIETVKLAPNKTINCTFCPSGNANYVRCHRMFLLSEKLSDIGYGPFKNCLPILLLSCKFNIREIFGPSTLPNQQHQKSEEILCMWLSSVYQFPVNYSLNVWKHGRDKSEESFIKSISSISSCLSIKESNLEIATSALSLTYTEYMKAIDADNMINCQVKFN